MSEASVKGKRLVSTVNADARFGVFSNACFEKVCFALKANHFHPLEWVPNFEVTGNRGRGAASLSRLVMACHHDGC